MGIYPSTSQIRGQERITHGYARSQFFKKVTEVSISDVPLEREWAPAFLPWGLRWTLQGAPGRSDAVAQRRGRHGKDAKEVAYSKLWWRRWSQRQQRKWIGQVHRLFVLIKQKGTCKQQSTKDQCLGRTFGHNIARCTLLWRCNMRRNPEGLVMAWMLGPREINSKDNALLAMASVETGC